MNYPTPTPPPPPSWLYGLRFLNNGVWTNYKSQSWYWTMSEVDRLPLFNNSRENFFFKISNLLFSQWLPESSLWTFLFETLLKYGLTKTNSSPLDLCSDCCLLFYIPLTSGLGGGAGVLFPPLSFPHSSSLSFLVSDAKLTSLSPNAVIHCLFRIFHIT